MDPVDVLTELLKIDGGPGDEHAVAEFITGAAIKAGCPASRFRDDGSHKRIGTGERGNLILKVPGRGRKGPRRLFTAHMDTVPLCVGASPVREGDVIRGVDPSKALGGDNRTGCAVLLNLLLKLLASDEPHPPLTFVWLVQEEVGLRGARHIAVNKLGSPVEGYNFDGTHPDRVVIGATGDVAIDIRIRGHASHAGVAPERGVSAAAVFAAAIAELHADGWHGLIEKSGGRGTSNVGVVSGGAATNVVMDDLAVRAEVRSHSPKFRQRILARWRKAFEKAAAAHESIDGKTATIEWDEELKYEAFKLPVGSDVVKSALKAVRDCGSEPTTVVGNGGLDANWLTAHGIPTVTLGCGQRDIHTTAEWLHVPSYLTACEVAHRLAVA